MNHLSSKDYILINLDLHTQIILPFKDEGDKTFIETITIKPYSVNSNNRSESGFNITTHRMRRLNLPLKDVLRLYGSIYCQTILNQERIYPFDIEALNSLGIEAVQKEIESNHKNGYYDMTNKGGEVISLLGEDFIWYATSSGNWALFGKEHSYIDVNSSNYNSFFNIEEEIVEEVDEVDEDRAPRRRTTSGMRRVSK
jgi:hypothetical protein